MHDSGGGGGGGFSGGGFDGGHHGGGHMGGGHDAGGGFGVSGHHHGHHQQPSGWPDQNGPVDPSLGDSRGMRGYRGQPPAVSGAGRFARLLGVLLVLAFIVFVAYQMVHGASTTP